MKKIAGYIFILAVAVVFAAYPLQSASAQSGEYYSGPYQTGGYFGIWGGYTIAPDLTYEYCDDWDCDEYDLNIDIDETAVFGAKLGFSPPQFRVLALELEYLYLNPDMTYYDETVGDIEFNNFMFNIIWKIPFGVVHPYGGGGIGFSHHEMSAEDGEWISRGDDTGYAWQLMAGVEFDLAYNLSLDLGYRYFVTEMELDDDDDDYDHDHEDSRDIEFSTSMVTLGFKFRF